MSSVLEQLVKRLDRLEDELKNTKNESQETKYELQGTKNELQETKNELQQTKNELQETKNELQQTKLRSNKMQKQLNKTMNEKEKMQRQINVLIDENEKLVNQVKDLQSDKEELEKTRALLEDIIRKLPHGPHKSAWKYHLNMWSTYSESRRFAIAVAATSVVLLSIVGAGVVGTYFASGALVAGTKTVIVSGAGAFATAGSFVYVERQSRRKEHVTLEESDRENNSGSQAESSREQDSEANEERTYQPTKRQVCGVRGVLGVLAVA